jgi:uncharacterized lipoprotein YmbA
MNKWHMILCLLLATGCSTQGASSIAYYHFDITKANTTQRSILNIPRLEVIPVLVPEYLNLRGMAQRVNRHQTVNANWHLWSSAPGTMLDIAALNQLERQLPGWLVVSAEEPWLNDNNQVSDKNTKLQFKIERFNGGLNNDAELAGSWTLFDQNNQVVMRQNFAENIALQADGYEGLAAALQAGWEKICNDVASQIKNR